MPRLNTHHDVTAAPRIIDEELVRRLVASQFPYWAQLPVRSVANGGWDNRTFRLGEQMLARLPSAAGYEPQVFKEQQWLPVLSAQLPLPIPEPLAFGRAAEDYPLRWSVYGWIEGDVATPELIEDLCGFATVLAQFLVALQSINPHGGPKPGQHNFQRGGRLSYYDAETRRAIAALKDHIDSASATRVWEAALQSAWLHSPVWVHGDVSPGNLLVREGRLSAVIDFGMLAIGDPASDLAIAWTLFEGKSRNAFRAALPLDANTWLRGRGWALWKALIVAAGHAGTNAVESALAWHTIEAVLRESAEQGV